MSQKAKRGARADLFPGGVPELEELAGDIAACEERLTIVHAGILTVMDRRDWARRGSRRDRRPTDPLSCGPAGRARHRRGIPLRWWGPRGSCGSPASAATSAVVTTSAGPATLAARLARFTDRPEHVAVTEHDLPAGQPGPHLRDRRMVVEGIDQVDGDGGGGKGVGGGEHDLVPDELDDPAATLV